MKPEMEKKHIHPQSSESQVLCNSGNTEMTIPRMDMQEPWIRNQKSASEDFPGSCGEAENPEARKMAESAVKRHTSPMMDMICSFSSLARYDPCVAAGHTSAFFLEDGPTLPILL